MSQMLELSGEVKCELSKATALGHNLVSLFNIDPGFVDINNGSYGRAPKCVYEVKDRIVQRAEACADRFYR